MGYGASLQRKLDEDLIDQIEANGKVVRPKKHKPAREPGGRPKHTYRAERRRLAKQIYHGQKVKLIDDPLMENGTRLVASKALLKPISHFMEHMGAMT